MTRYLLSIFQPEGPQPTPAALRAIMADVDAFRREATAASAWVFSAGLQAPSTAAVVRAGADDIDVTDGPFSESKEYIGGFVIVEAPDVDAAIQWGGKLSRATTLPVEVRPLRDEEQAR